MSMREAIQAVNRLKADGLIDDYAIGGGIAAIYYSETMLTFDLDIFVVLPQGVPPLDSLKHLHQWARKRGFSFHGEHVEIGKVMVQFLPDYNALVHEAVERADSITFERQPARIVRLEHLMAIMAHTGRPKDAQRLRQLHDDAKYDKRILNGILDRFGLVERFKKLTGKA